MSFSAGSLPWLSTKFLIINALTGMPFSNLPSVWEVCLLGLLTKRRHHDTEPEEPGFQSRNRGASLFRILAMPTHLFDFIVSISQSRYFSFQETIRPPTTDPIPSLSFNLAIEILLFSGHRHCAGAIALAGFNLAIEILLFSG